MYDLILIFSSGPGAALCTVFAGFLIMYRKTYHNYHQIYERKLYSSL